ncbi:hypothetical protein [Brucella tritici]|uniref:Uncharacterized protein n=1 Tax=Brucella tritici TaxID=94626 RepID=A0A6L3Y8I8_9HYPH|nr:hypothetical protein [Brucella tritici]KAB2675775.1 hypothetical protein F9L08_27525 [Brucella tritici]
MTATDIDYLKTMMPEPYEPLASFFEHKGNLYCLASRADKQSFQASIPAAKYDVVLQAFVIPSSHELAPAAQDWTSERNEYGSYSDLWADTCRPAFGTLKTLEGNRQRGVLESVNGHVYRSIWNKDGQTAFVPANAPEALFYMQVTGIRDDIYLSNFEADLASFWRIIGSIRSWTRKDGIPMLSRLANDAVMRLRGWYYFKRQQVVVDVVENAIRELAYSLPSVRKSNAMIVDSYENEIFEMADIFQYFSLKPIGGYTMENR